MLFASRSLVAQIERAECGLLRDSIEAIAKLHPERDATAIPLMGGVTTYSGEGSPLNKVAGLGFDGSPGPRELEEVERFYLRKRCPVQVERSSLADPDVAPLLTSRGYRLVSFENVLGRALRTEGDVTRSAPAPIDVKKTDERDFTSVARYGRHRVHAAG